ncbi:N-acetyltransferase [uncultured Sphingomonas sp.]|uniref:GNAT family N-acetyltransferase n=1 Tax=uncultured Sphingomonas sp. TaxID=158754 RepID=UPI0025D99BB5|nr:GNAT family N-acetyltransferase [uncultured Sphingomonas sp.]
MTASTLAWRVERACAVAYPPRLVDRIGGWSVARSGGGSRRSNAASAIAADAALDHDTLAAIAACYAADAQPTILRLTDLASVASGVLDTRFSNRIAGEVRIGEAPDAMWLAARRRLSTGIEEPRDVAARLVHPAAYARRVWEGRTVAIGYVCMHHGVAILEAIATEPSARRHGHGAAIVAALIDWTEAQGAEAIALQVEEANTPARALYARLGFTVDLYGYHYRRSGPCATLA